MHLLLNANCPAAELTQGDANLQLELGGLEPELLELLLVTASRVHLHA